MKRGLLLFLSLLGVPWAVFSADDVEELKSFSDFKEVNLEALVNGKILAQEGEMDFDRGITAQACCILKVTPEQAVKRYEIWDAPRCEALKLYFHLPLSSPPSDEDFRPLTFNQKQRPYLWLIEKTRETKPQHSPLYLSNEETVQMAKCMEANGDPAELALNCWKNILKSRASNYQKQGFTHISPYETGPLPVHPGTELHQLLDQAPKITNHFSTLLAAAFSGNSDGMQEKPRYYLELQKTNGHAVFNLGAIYHQHADHVYQVFDCTYYSSSDISSSCTFRQIWPITVEGKQASLVWRGDLLASSLLADRLGIERRVAGIIMVNSLKSVLHLFQQEVADMQ